MFIKNLYFLFNLLENYTFLRQITFTNAEDAGTAPIYFFIFTCQNRRERRSMNRSLQ